jgi:hypothetical protein
MNNPFEKNPTTAPEDKKSPEQLNQEYIDKGLGAINDEVARLTQLFEAYKKSNPTIDPQEAQEKFKKMFAGILEKINEAQIILSSPDLDINKYDPYKDNEKK